MAVSSKWYGQAFAKAFNKEIDLDSDAIKVMLVTSAYVPDQDAHVYKSAVTNEVSGAGYTAGGQLLSGVTVTYSAASNTLKFDANDSSWPASSFTARYAVIYDASPATAALQPLLAYVDFGADIPVAGGAFDLIYDANGIVTITVA